MVATMWQIQVAMLPLLQPSQHHKRKMWQVKLPVSGKRLKSPNRRQMPRKVPKSINPRIKEFGWAAVAREKCWPQTMLRLHLAGTWWGAELMTRSTRWRTRQTSVSLSLTPISNPDQDQDCPSSSVSSVWRRRVRWMISITGTLRYLRSLPATSLVTVFRLWVLVTVTRALPSQTMDLLISSSIRSSNNQITLLNLHKIDLQQVLSWLHSITILPPPPPLESN